jgi:hypothetical protein
MTMNEYNQLICRVSSPSKAWISGFRSYKNPTRAQRKKESSTRSTTMHTGHILFVLTTSNRFLTSHPVIRDPSLRIHSLLESAFETKQSPRVVAYQTIGEPYDNNNNNKRYQTIQNSSSHSEQLTPQNFIPLYNQTFPPFDLLAYSHPPTMENPHEARQAVLLERIGKNVEKCHEAVQELNVCLNVSLGEESSSFYMLVQNCLEEDEDGGEKRKDIRDCLGSWEDERDEPKAVNDNLITSDPQADHPYISLSSSFDFLQFATPITSSYRTITTTSSSSLPPARPQSLLSPDDFLSTPHPHTHGTPSHHNVSRSPGRLYPLKTGRSRRLCMLRCGDDHDTRSDGMKWRDDDRSFSIRNTFRRWASLFDVITHRPGRSHSLLCPPTSLFYLTNLSTSTRTSRNPTTTHHSLRCESPSLNTPNIPRTQHPPLHPLIGNNQILHPNHPSHFGPVRRV